mmetsp:Transcript_27623/g.58790  ORF Transcript_27623/g.58790 Transcript_27623/m.58790 type:complete len:107 (+) Transcript_27623:204-524(+)
MPASRPCSTTTNKDDDKKSLTSLSVYEERRRQGGGKGGRWQVEGRSSSSSSSSSHALAGFIHSPGGEKAHGAEAHSSQPKTQSPTRTPGRASRQELEEGRVRSAAR